MRLYLRKTLSFAIFCFLVLTMVLSISWNAYHVSSEEMPPQADSVSPQPDSTRIFTDSDIIINFTKSMERETVFNTLIYIVDSQENHASTNGVLTWSDSDRTLTFSPYSKMQHNKTYTYIINLSSEDTSGVLFDGDSDGVGGEVGEDDYIWSFTTIPEPPKVLTIAPRNQEQEVAVDSIISVKFSKAMDQASVEDAFSFTHSSTDTTWGASDCNVTWVSLSKVEFEPNFDLDFESVYTVTIEATCQSTEGVTLDGNKNKKPEGVPEDTYDWLFTTIAEPPKIISIDPVEGTTEILVDTEIVITFDKSMDTRSTEKAFSYSYDSNEEFDANSGVVTWTSGDKVMTFKTDSDFEEGKTYTFEIDNSAKDDNGIEFQGHTWILKTKINSEPELEGGGVHPEKGDSSETFTFTILYTDEDDDKPEKIYVIIDDVEWKMEESDRSEDSFINGKTYEWALELEAGDHKYYFEVENEKHTARYPKGQVMRTLKISEASDESSLGMEGDIAGIPAMICIPIGIIMLVGIIVAVVMMSKRGKARKQAAASASWAGTDQGDPTMAFLPADSGEEFVSFDMEPEEDFVSFQAFDETAPPVDAPPVMIKCPECGEMLKVRAAKRPFHFPCKCGAKLVLK